jgi:hypothetical protein
MKRIFMPTFLISLLMTTHVYAKTTKIRTVQEVNFSEMSLKGTIRNPDGAYLVQKKGLKFMPLYEIQKDLDKKIRETSAYLE